MQKNILNPSTYSKEHLNLRTQLRFQPIIELNLCLPSWRRYGRPKKVFRKPKNHWLLFSCCVFSWLSSRLVSCGGCQVVCACVTVSPHCRAHWSTLSPVTHIRTFRSHSHLACLRRSRRNSLEFILQANPNLVSCSEVDEFYITCFQLQLFHVLCVLFSSNSSGV